MCSSAFSFPFFSRISCCCSELILTLWTGRFVLADASQQRRATVAISSRRAARRAARSAQAVPTPQRKLHPSAPHAAQVRCPFRNRPLPRLKCVCGAQGSSLRVWRPRAAWRASRASTIRSSAKSAACPADRALSQTRPTGRLLIPTHRKLTF